MTGSFSPGFVVAKGSDGRNFTLLEPLTFTRPAAVGGQVITIPAGATTDGGSTPAMLWGVGLPPFGEDTWMAYVLHDGLFRATSVPQIDDFDTANLILFEALVALGCSETKARYIYAGVSSGVGRAAWNEDRASGKSS